MEHLRNEADVSKMVTDQGKWLDGEPIFFEETSEKRHWKPFQDLRSRFEGKASRSKNGTTQPLSVRCGFEMAYRQATLSVSGFLIAPTLYLNFRCSMTNR